MGMSNKQVCKAFLGQHKPSGKSNNGNLYFEGKTLYSYGEHYPLARLDGLDTIFVNSTHSTITTEGKHKNALWHSIHALKREMKILRVDCEALKNPPAGMPIHVGKAINSKIANIKESHRVMGKMRKESTRSWQKQRTEELYVQYAMLCEHFNEEMLKLEDILGDDDVKS